MFFSLDESLIPLFFLKSMGCFMKTHEISQHLVFFRRCFSRSFFPFVEEAKQWSGFLGGGKFGEDMGQVSLLRE